MTGAKRVDLLDAAMRSTDPIAFLDGIQSARDYAGRKTDVLLIPVIHTLLIAGGIETLMFMRAEWQEPRALVHRRRRKVKPFVCDSSVHQLDTGGPARANG